MAKQWDNHKEVLETIQNQIGGCFGSSDFEFAVHPSDEDRAKDLRAYALTNKISLNEVVGIAKDFLLKKRCTAEHIDNQMPDVKKFFGKMLK
jgi:hypothetical protein